jgi:WD40 repeat protein
LIWSPKSKTPVININDSGDTAIRDFKWSNVDVNQQNNSSSNNSGVGFIVTLGMDQNVKLYDIASNRAEHLLTLYHDNHISHLSLSPDNSLLAVGGQNSEIYVWSLKDQKLLRCFYNPLIQNTARQDQ